MQGWLSDLAGRTKDLVDEVASADLVVLIASAGESVQAASVIGEACTLRRVMTTALILGGTSTSDEAMTKQTATAWIAARRELPLRLPISPPITALPTRQCAPHSNEQRRTVIVPPHGRRGAQGAAQKSRGSCDSLMVRASAMASKSARTASVAEGASTHPCHGCAHERAPMKVVQSLARIWISDARRKALHERIAS